jgi:hypothetical protein
VLGADNHPAIPDVALEIGDQGLAGGATIFNKIDQPVIDLNGVNGTVTLGTGRGAAGSLVVRSKRNGPVMIVSGDRGQIELLDAELKTTLIIDAVKGDIELLGADCAEDFAAAEDAEAGSVLCLDAQGLLRPCAAGYDRMVAGVVSGGGGNRPALRLNRGASFENTATLALAGKVFCRVDADQSPVAIGDLLTTSPTRGHAMKATDRNRSFGAILGKSLGGLASGCGLVPVLVSLG